MRYNGSRLCPPRRRGGLCERRYLLDSLDEPEEAQVTLIVAPPGYGKTTLISQWCARLAERQAPVAYYAASPRDCDPVTFLAMIAAALERCGIEIGERHAFDKAGNPREDLSVEDILLALELGGQRIVLIIDDFEGVNEAAVVDRLADFINAAPPSVHLVIVSRVFPAIPLSALELEGRLRLIDSYQLRLRRDELAWMLDLDADMSEVREVASLTQGWPVTAELYRLWRTRHQGRDTRATFGGHVSEVQNYLAEQLFSSLPPEQYALLVDIADCEEVHGELVDAMRGRDDSAQLLQACADILSSLMWSGREGEATLYRLHPLIRDHLRQKLAAEPTRRGALAARAADWLAERQRYAEAVRSALNARDEAVLARIIRTLRPMHILVADGAAALRAILRELPDGEIARHPRLQIMSAIALFKTGLFAESRVLLDRIRMETADFTLDPDGHGDWLEMEGTLVDLMLSLQMSRPVPDVEDRCTRLMTAFPDDPIVCGSCQIMLMMACQLRGDFDGCEAAVLRARAVYDTTGPSRYGASQIFGHELLALLGRGRLHRAADLIGVYQKRPGETVPDDNSTPVLTRLIHAAVRYQQEYSDTAVEALQTSFAEHSKAESWIDQYAIAYPSIAMRLYLREGLAAASDFLEDACRRARHIALDALPDFVRILQVDFHARAADITTAQAFAAEIGLEEIVAGADPQAPRRGWRERDTAVIALSRLQIARDETGAARATIDAAIRASRIGGRLQTEIKAIILSVLLHSRSDIEAAAAGLRAALLLAYPEGFVAPFAEEGVALLPVIDMLLAQDDLDGFARRHLDRIKRCINGAMARTDNSQLNAREQEILAHLAEGLSNKVIARRMGITDHTVKFHLKKVFAKLEVSSRRAAVAKVTGGGKSA